MSLRVSKIRYTVYLCARCGTQTHKSRLECFSLAFSGCSQDISNSNDIWKDQSLLTHLHHSSHAKLEYKRTLYHTTPSLLLPPISHLVKLKTTKSGDDVCLLLFPKLTIKAAIWEIVPRGEKINTHWNLHATTSSVLLPDFIYVIKTKDFEQDKDVCILFFLERMHRYLI